MDDFKDVDMNDVEQWLTEHAEEIAEKQRQPEWLADVLMDVLTMNFGADRWSPEQVQECRETFVYAIKRHHVDLDLLDAEEVDAEEVEL